MSSDIYLTQLHCHRCRANAFISHIEKDHGDWIAVCPRCGAENIVALARVENVPVLSPTIQVIGWRR